MCHSEFDFLIEESSSETFRGGSLTPPPLVLITLCYLLATYECVFFNVINDSI